MEYGNLAGMRNDVSQETRDAKDLRARSLWSAINRSEEEEVAAAVNGR